MSEQRAELDPLDVPLSRADFLNFAREFSQLLEDRERTKPLALDLRDAAAEMRAQWSKPPEPEKATGEITDEPHDA